MVVGGGIAWAGESHLEVGVDGDPHVVGRENGAASVVAEPMPSVLCALCADIGRAVHAIGSHMTPLSDARGTCTWWMLPWHSTTRSMPAWKTTALERRIRFLWTIGVLCACICIREPMCASLC